MFKNVEKTIKFFAWVMAIIGIVTLILGLFCLVVAMVEVLKHGSGLFLLCTVISFVGAIPLLVSSVFVYGFGELIEQAKLIQKNTSYLNEENKIDEIEFPVPNVNKMFEYTE